MPKHLTPAELAEQLGIASDKITDWIAAGELRAVNVAANARGKRARWRISETEVERFLAARQNQADPAPARRTRKPALTGVRNYF